MHRIDPPPSLVPEVATLDPARMARLRRVGWLLDNSIPIPGTRYRLGIDQIIGLVPGHRRPDRRRPLALHHRRGVAARRAPRAARAHGLERRGRHAGRRDPPPGRPVRHRLQGQHPEPRPARRLRGSGRSRCGARAAGSSRCWSPGWCSSPPGRSPWPWSSFASSRDCSSDRTRARTLGLQHRHLRPRHRPRDRVLPRPARAAAHASRARSGPSSSARALESACIPPCIPTRGPSWGGTPGSRCTCPTCSTTAASSTSAA